ncbi:MAG TPA: hypothetical protein VGI56_06085, partial [Galbitalea sp.]
MTTPGRTSVDRVVRSVFAALPLVARRRARRDVVLLIAWTALVAFVVLLALAAPWQVTETLDRGAQQAVADAGSASDILIQLPVGVARTTSPPVEAPGRVAVFAKGVEAELPRGIRQVYSSTTAAVIGTPLPLTNATRTSGLTSTRMQLGMLTSANSKGLIVESGRLPQAGTVVPTKSPIEIALSAADARATDLHVGSIVTVQAAGGQTTPNSEPIVPLKVVGIFTKGATGTANWLDAPSVWTPDEPSIVSAVQALGITALTNPAGVTMASAEYGELFTGYIRVHVNPEKFSGE